MIPILSDLYLYVLIRLRKKGKKNDWYETFYMFRVRKRFR